MSTYITSIGTAVPDYTFDQSLIGEFMAEAAKLTPEERIKLRALYRASGIKQRHSVIRDYGTTWEDFKFFPANTDLEPFPTVRDRMALYEKEALPLAIKAVKNCLSNLQNNESKNITHLITVSCTGMYAPGLDIELLQALNLPGSTQRTCINYMGCYAAFNALKVADSICRANSNAKVLVICLELCTIHFQKSKNWDHLLSNALFSDGASAALIQSKPVGKVNLSVESFYCDIEPAGKNDMAWNISDFGFEMTLSSYIPELVKGGIASLTANLLKNRFTPVGKIDFYGIHPGGKKILESIEEELGLSKEDNKYAYKVLRDYGNMSSATVLFVLKEIMEDLTKDDNNKNILSFAFGPGLTLESMFLKTYVNSENSALIHNLENSDVRNPLK